MAQKPLPAPEASSASPASQTTTKTISSDRRTIHMTLQHKGGVGKSFVANCIAQFYVQQNRPVKVVDADPSNKSLAAYKALNVESLDIMTANNTVNSRAFDDIIDSIVASDIDFVIDNGATNFLPFMAYLVDNNVAEVLSENGRDLVVHVPIVGAEAMLETIQGFDDIARNLGGHARIIVWLNEALKGAIQPGGKDFEALPVYSRHKDSISALVRVPHHVSELFAQDMDQLLTRKMTFDEAINSPDFRLMAKQRLKQIQREIFDQLAIAV
ncbi:MAG: conjugal transfer protein TraL [Proteobacteria bacterium]|nr:conjugal transfer protein TraL [Pseudomonadota bacterium]